jgi:hypothetical protein
VSPTERAPSPRAQFRDTAFGPNDPNPEFAVCFLSLPRQRSDKKLAITTQQTTKRPLVTINVNDSSFLSQFIFFPADEKSGCLKLLQLNNLSVEGRT